MIEDEDRAADEVELPVANDLPSPKRSFGLAQTGNGNGEVLSRIDAAVRQIARLLGRLMAREEFERLSAANDNRPPERPDD